MTTITASAKPSCHVSKWNVARAARVPTIANRARAAFTIRPSRPALGMRSRHSSATPANAPPLGCWRSVNRARSGIARRSAIVTAAAWSAISAERKARARRRKPLQGHVLAPHGAPLNLADAIDKAAKIDRARGARVTLQQHESSITALHNRVLIHADWPASDRRNLD